MRLAQCSIQRLASYSAERQAHHIVGEQGRSMGRSSQLLRLTVEVVIERVQEKLEDQERRAASVSVEDSVCFIFPDEDPEKIEEQKQKAYEWARQLRVDRIVALDEIQDKIEAIQQKVFSEPDPLKRQTYERWYEYLKGA
jgi:hypothetical protein